MFKIKKAFPTVGVKVDKKSGIEVTGEWQPVKEITPKIQTWIDFGEVIVKENENGKSTASDNTKNRTETNKSGKK